MTEFAVILVLAAAIAWVWQWAKATETIRDPVVDQALRVSHWRRYPPRQGTFTFPRSQPDGEPTAATDGLRDAVDWDSL